MKSWNGVYTVYDLPLDEDNSDRIEFNHRGEIYSWAVWSDLAGDYVELDLRYMSVRWPKAVEKVTLLIAEEIKQIKEDLRTERLETQGDE